MRRKNHICIVKSHLLALVYLVFTGCGPSLSAEKVRFSCHDWTYEAQIRGINGVIVEHATLSYRNKAVPLGLVKNGFSFYTLIGSFIPIDSNLIPHATTPPWWTDGFSPPCEAFSRVDQSVGLTEQVLALGFYRVDIGADQNLITEQAPVQNRETPADWIFIRNARVGYWVNPSKMDLLAVPILNDFAKSN